VAQSRFVLTNDAFREHFPTLNRSLLSDQARQFLLDIRMRGCFPLFHMEAFCAGEKERENVES
jgi:hypothetical protein